LPNYGNASALTYGRGVGCSFYDTSAAAYAAAHHSQLMYCPTFGAGGCTSDFLAQGQCGRTTLTGAPMVRCPCSCPCRPAPPSTGELPQPPPFACVA
jgi:hypothetical protein